MPPLFVPEEDWGPGSWRPNHPSPRRPIHHGLREAQYGYWGFSPGNIPEGGYAPTRRAFATRGTERALRPVVGVEEFAAEPRGSMIACGPGADQLRGTARDDVICAGAGDDRIAARGGDDALFGDLGDDVVRGGRRRGHALRRRGRRSSGRRRRGRRALGRTRRRSPPGRTRRRPPRGRRRDERLPRRRRLGRHIERLLGGANRCRSPGAIAPVSRHRFGRGRPIGATR
jgi:RTX calcium-binding nonapeptide repeat (4 copies)